MTYTQGNLGDRTRALRALELARSADDRRSWCRPRTCSGTSNTRRAMRPAPASCSLAAWKDSRRSVSRGARGTRSSARRALAFGDTAQAERLLDEATSVLRETGPWFLNLLYVRAILAVRRGDADAAIGFVRETVDLQPAAARSLRVRVRAHPSGRRRGTEGDDVWVARILGARDAITERTGTTCE